MTKVANRWNVPRRKRKEVRRAYLLSSGWARCIQHNGHGFEVGEVYEFKTEIRADHSGLPPYDVVKVFPNTDYRKDSPSWTWVFINRDKDLFSEAFEIV